VVVPGADGELLVFFDGGGLGCFVFVGDGVNAGPMNGMCTRRFAALLGFLAADGLDDLVVVATAGFATGVPLGVGLTDGSGGALVVTGRDANRSASCGKLVTVDGCGPCATTTASAARTPRPATVTPIFSQSADDPSRRGAVCPGGRPWRGS
jgi:hypothetical protein